MDRGGGVESERRDVLLVEEGQQDRLDRFVSARTGLSRTRVQSLIGAGLVEVDGRQALKSERVEPGSSVTVQIPPAEPVEIMAEDLPLTVLYQDEDLLVVDKATGMVVHPAPGHRTGTLVNALLYHVKDLSGVGGRMRPGIVHRLDKDTSGLLVVAKSDRAHLGLSDALKQRRVKRLYRAACWGHLEESPVTVNAPIGRDPNDRKRMAVVAEGRNAITRARVKERWLRADLLDVALQTGRTHQIRVHLAHIGHPVVGDEVYGSGWARGMGGPDRIWAQQLERRMRRQFLHAAELVFDHPVTGLRMRFRSPLPEDLASVAAWARSEGESP
ncbi:MAG TPA: RluA family pseudouridine synthase [Longimicrobiales bacterium]|nr:RluA family pseudouridine synthase [Longimicrobiales bacterium]